MTATSGMTIREIVANDYRTAAVFERYGLDFCCSGCRTIEQSCRESDVNRDALLRDLDDVLAAPPADSPDYASWDAATLIGYIVSHHHAYVRESLPSLVRHADRLVEVHAGRHPELRYLRRLLYRIADEMTGHMAKEEQVLFPYLETLEAAVRDGRPTPPAPFGSVRNPIRAMEGEHQFVGDAMAEIRQLTGGYQPPDDACGTYRVWFEELAAFERDLHAHVHLENNILFPNAATLEGGRS